MVKLKLKEGWTKTSIVANAGSVQPSSITTLYVAFKIGLTLCSKLLPKPLSQLKYDLDEHFEKGGTLLGHNIVAFDLPILRDSMDIYCIRKYLKEERYIDTSKIMLKTAGERYSLSNLVQHTLGEDKLMNSADAPVMWKAGEYDAVAEYCLKDCELVYDLWKHGKDNNFVKGYSAEKEEEKTMEVVW